MGGSGTDRRKIGEGARHLLQCWERVGRRRKALLALTLAGVVAFWGALPEPLFDKPLSRVLLDREGGLLGARIAADEQWRFPPGEVPERFRTAIVEFEDRRFARHPGVDPLAVARAAWLNLREGRVVSGGSTLSMQVIRLARDNPPRTLTEKAREAVLALRLELRHSKAQILALYAANAPFGGNVVGLEAASWRYFGRRAADLSWAEASLLAVLPNSPAQIHPGRRRQALQQSRDRLLHRLHQRGHLSALELELALHEPLPQQPRPMPRLAPHLLDTLCATRPGHLFRTTLDPRLQQAADEVVRRHSRLLRQGGIHNAAAVVIDNRTFEVLAYVGNSDLGADPERGYAIDLVRRPRSTGSILKPLLFAAMLQQGEILPATLVPDIPTQIGGYMPENFDRGFRGAVPAWLALARSLNIPAVRMLREHGVERFAASLRQMGMSTLHRSAEDYGLSLILGGAEGTLWDMAALYANLAALARDGREKLGGEYRRPVLVADEESRTGRVLELGQGAAWLALEALVEVTRPGGEDYWENFSSAQKIAWKTGTSFGLRDGWAIGSTPRHTVGVWVGNAGGEGVPGLTGVTAAGPILFALFNLLESGDWFSVPFGDLREVEVCADDGYLASVDCRTVRQWAPRGSHFDKVTPFHRRIHLDQGGTWQVHAGCEPVAQMSGRSWFVLPPAQEFYYRRRNPGYRGLPPFRPDCRALPAEAGAGPIDLLYPLEGTRLFIPRDLDGRFSRTVFEAVHRDRDSTLYWHLDDQYLGATRTFHQQAVLIDPGWHRLTLVDEQGHTLERRFQVLSRE